MRLRKIRKTNMAQKTQVEIQVDYEKRRDKCTKEVDAVLKKYDIGLKVQWNQNGPYLALLDVKTYEDSKEKPAK